MERITGAGGASSAQPIYPRLAAFGVDAGQSASVATPRDHVEISPLGQMLDGISRLPDIRHEKVEEIRQPDRLGNLRDSREDPGCSRPAPRRVERFLSEPFPADRVN